MRILLELCPRGQRRRQPSSNRNNFEVDLDGANSTNIILVYTASQSRDYYGQLFWRRSEMILFLCATIVLGGDKIQIFIIQFNWNGEEDGGEHHQKHNFSPCLTYLGFNDWRMDGRRWKVGALRL